MKRHSTLVGLVERLLSALVTIVSIARVSAPKKKERVKRRKTATIIFTVLAEN